MEILSKKFPKMSQRITTLKNFYLLFFGVLVLSIVLTPILIRDGFSFIEEEAFEVVILIFLSLIGFSIYYLYQREIQKSQKEMDEALDHIGKINVQIGYIREAFSDIEKYPETKSDFKYALKTLSERILGVANTGWVFLKIIDTEKSRTLTEYFRSRGGKFDKSICAKYDLGNKNLIENKINNLVVVSPSQDNFSVKAFCILPKKKITEDEEMLLKKVVSDIEMLYLIFTSSYYKDTRASNQNT